jgi:opacity protein-like surface antigen
MRKLLLGAVASTALCLGAMQVSAADIIEPVPEPMGWSWYISVFGGWSHPLDEDLSFEYSTTFSGDVDLDPDNGFMAGIALGAHINEWLRGEVEISGAWHDVSGEVAFGPNGSPASTTYDIDGDESALFVLANLWVDIPVGDVFRPYVGGGIGFGLLNLDFDFEDTLGADYKVVDDDDWGFAYQLGAGIAFNFATNMAFDIGYRYKVINNAEFDVDDGICALCDASLWDGDDKDYRSHNIIAGIRIGF